MSAFGVFLVRVFLIRNEYGEILLISPYLVRMQENTDQKNSEYKHFLRSVKHVLLVLFDVIPGIYFFYKKKDIPTWKEPGTVTGQNRQQILIKHGPTYVRVHPCNTQLKNIDKTVLIYKTRFPGMMKLSLARKLS